MKPRRRQSGNRKASTVAVGAGGGAAGVPLWVMGVGLLGLLGLVGVVFWPGVLGAFVWDDSVFLLEAEPVRQGLGGLRDIWFNPSTMVEGHYWPLVYSSFWLEHKLWGFDPMGYHATNVLLHCINTLLLWRLAGRLALPGAWFVAALFAVHPVHTEPVVWIISRKDLLGSLFYLLAAGCWLQWRSLQDERLRRGKKRPGRGKGNIVLKLGSNPTTMYMAMLLLFVAGMLSKSFVVTLPAALLIWAWWKHGRVTAADVMHTAPLFLIGIAIVAADLSFYFGRAVLDFDYFLPQRLIIASKSLWFYASKLLWPHPLPVIYPRWDVNPQQLLNWLPLLGALVLALGLYLARERIGRGALAGALFFAVTLSPVLGFANNSYMGISFVADRYQYLASAGLLAVFTGAVIRIVGLIGHQTSYPPPVRLQAKPLSYWLPLKGGAMLLSVVFSTALLAGLGVLSHRQAWVYRDPITFFGHISISNPGEYHGHYNLGLAYMEKGRYEEAEAPARRAIEIAPDSASAHQNLAVIMNNLQRYAETFESLRTATALSAEQTAEQYYFIGHIASQAGLDDEAERYLLEALAMEPEHREARQRLVYVYLHAGRYTDALTWDPQLAEGLERAAVAAFSDGRYDDALDNFRHVLALKPNEAEGYANVGSALGQLGRFQEALEHFEQALALDPELESARMGRDAALQRLGGEL